MAQSPERTKPRELDLAPLTEEWFNVDYLAGNKSFTSDIRFGLLATVNRNWPHVIVEDGDEIAVSRNLLEEGRVVLNDVLSSVPYEDPKIAEAIKMVKRGEDPLSVQRVLDDVENDPPLSGGSFKRAIMATAYMTVALRARRENQIGLFNLMFDAGISLLAQEVVARRQFAQNIQPPR